VLLLKINTFNITSTSDIIKESGTIILVISIFTSKGGVVIREVIIENINI
jgi:hypothetical protein